MGIEAYPSGQAASLTFSHPIRALAPLPHHPTEYGATNAFFYSKVSKDSLKDDQPV